VFSSVLEAAVGVCTRTSDARCSRVPAGTATEKALRLALAAPPERRQAWTTSSRPPPAKPSASSRAPKPAEAATVRPVRLSNTATSQSPAGAATRAPARPAAGIVIVLWEYPEPPSSSFAWQSRATAAGTSTVVESRPAAEAGDAAASEVASASRTHAVRARCMDASTHRDPDPCCQRGSAVLTRGSSHAWIASTRKFASTMNRVASTTSACTRSTSRLTSARSM
jgi:hypothetical protein